jgi:hypothetical protein
MGRTARTVGAFCLQVCYTRRYMIGGTGLSVCLSTEQVHGLVCVVLTYMLCRGHVYVHIHLYVHIFVHMYGMGAGGPRRARLGGKQKKDIIGRQSRGPERHGKAWQFITCWSSSGRAGELVSPFLIKCPGGWRDGYPSITC